MSDQHLPGDDVPGEYPSDAELEALLASLDHDDLAPPAPPPSVWAAIEAQLGGAANQQSAPAVTSIESRRQRRSGSALRWLAVAAAAVVIVSGALVIARRDDGQRVVATAQLQYEDEFDVAGAGASASAQLVERDGRYQIALSDSSLPQELGEPADLELWLIEKRADGTLDVQPVAIIDNGDGTFTVPDGLDPQTHNIVDISIEPRDGDATHSGRSILRGQLVKT